MIPLVELTPSELATSAKALDIHRASLAGRISRLSDDSVKRTLFTELQTCESAASKIKAEQTKQLAADGS